MTEGARLDGVGAGDIGTDVGPKGFEVDSGFDTGFDGVFIAGFDAGVDTGIDVVEAEPRESTDAATGAGVRVLVETKGTVAAAVGPT